MRGRAGQPLGAHGENLEQACPGKAPVTSGFISGKRKADFPFVRNKHFSHFICFTLFYVHWSFAYMYVYVRVSDPLEVKLQTVVDAGNLTHAI